MFEIKEVKCPINSSIDYNHEYLINYINDVLINKYHFKNVTNIEILSKSLDARHQDLWYLLRAKFKGIPPKKHYKEITNYQENEDYLKLINLQARPNNKTVIVVGMGPSGLFAALTLIRAGFKVKIIEQGKKVEDRIKDIELSQKGSFNPLSNIQFGEGGAGTFSDGKLTSGISSPYTKYVKETFYNLGADISILYDHYPHIGSDILQNVIKNFRNLLLSKGVEIYFETKLIGIDKHKIITNNPIVKEMYFDELVLACGHSAFDVYHILNELKVVMSPKNFAVGVRVEHPQSLISNRQYHGDYPNLPAANYKLVTHLDSGRSAYSFCMCPGGYVLNSTSDEHRLVTNGMSNFKRDGSNANAAILVNVNVDDYYRGNLFDGVRFIQDIEEKAYNPQYPYYYPIETMEDFLNNTDLKDLKGIEPSIKPGYYFTKIKEILPPFVTNSLKEALIIFNDKIKGFSECGLITAPETRTSSAIRIDRSLDGSTSIGEIYAVGEGAGYAGGIMSSAVDGIKIALKIIDKVGDRNE